MKLLNKFLFLFILGLFVIVVNCKKYGKKEDSCEVCGLGMLWILSQENQKNSFLIEIPAGLAK
ncbi:MAG: hypothetical protein ACK4UJ_00330 [Leptonema sp. (in: bacteria)]